LNLWQEIQTFPKIAKFCAKRKQGSTGSLCTWDNEELPSSQTLCTREIVGQSEPRNHQHTHHERLMVYGQETIFCCIPLLQLTTVVNYILTYVVTTRCLTYLLNCLSTQFYFLPTYIWYSPHLEPFSQKLLPS